jgi:hypothetical protein
MQKLDIAQFYLNQEPLYTCMRIITSQKLTGSAVNIDEVGSNVYFRTGQIADLLIPNINGCNTSAGLQEGSTTRS